MALGETRNIPTPTATPVQGPNTQGGAPNQRNPAPTPPELPITISSGWVPPHVRPVDRQLNSRLRSARPAPAKPL